MTTQNTYRMPAEFEPHDGCILIWPQRPGSWPKEAVKARTAFKEIIKAIAKSEKVYVSANAVCFENAKEALKDLENVEVFCCETDDAWARDVGPTFVYDNQNKVKGVDWQFNAWGGTYNGLYASWDKDQEFASSFCGKNGYERIDAREFVLEGGSIHSDGEGTIMVTASCLLSPGRNPLLTQEGIEDKLKKYLGAEKILWLPRGIYNDETDEHVDNVCAFVKPGEVVLAWTDDKNDPQYELSKACLDYLSSNTDAKGRNIKVTKLPIPVVPVVIREEDLDGYIFEAGEDEREAGERLAASYVNFYISNGAIVMPLFGGENEESDKCAMEILKNVYPEREVIGIYARDVLAGGGNIHCITQQIPAAKKG